MTSFVTDVTCRISNLLSAFYAKSFSVSYIRYTLKVMLLFVACSFAYGAWKSELRDDIRAKEDELIDKLRQIDALELEIRAANSVHIDRMNYITSLYNEQLGLVINATDTLFHTYQKRESGATGAVASVQQALSKISTELTELEDEKRKLESVIESKQKDYEESARKLQLRDIKHSKENRQVQLDNSEKMRVLNDEYNKNQEKVTELLELIKSIKAAQTQ